MSTSHPLTPLHYFLLTGISYTVILFLSFIFLPSFVSLGQASLDYLTSLGLVIFSQTLLHTFLIHFLAPPDPSTPRSSINFLTLSFFIATLTLILFHFLLPSVIHFTSLWLIPLLSLLQILLQHQVLLQARHWLSST